MKNTASRESGRGSYFGAAGGFFSLPSQEEVSKSPFKRKVG